MMEQYRLHNSWSIRDLLTFMTFSTGFLRKTSPMLLLQMDECKEHDREAFWAELNDISSRNEDPIKIVVTSSKPGTMAEELRSQKDLQVQEYALHSGEASDDENEYRERRITQLCPKHLGEARIRHSLERLENMDRDALDTSLNLIQIYTKWPEEVCSDNLSIFCSLLEDISPGSNIDIILLKILRSVSDQESFRWLLGWCLYGHRPMYKVELSMMLCYRKRKSAQDMKPPTEGEIQCCWKEIESQLRGLAEFHGDQVHMNDDVREILDNCEEQIWSEAKRFAQDSTAEFLLEYLVAPQIQERLEALHDRYQSLVKSSGNDITPPLIPDGRDAVFYAVQALPHHLSAIDIPEDVRRDMEDSQGRFAPWANVYWAMSNPLSRRANGPLGSAWATWVAAPEAGSPSMIRMPSFHVQDGATDQLSLVDMMIQAVRADKEDLALHLGDELISGEASQFAWPASILWRATWLGMNRLVEFLLDNGMQADDQSSYFCPSPLYMAARLGHAKIVHTFLAHGANYRVTGRADDTPLCAAALRGHADTMRILVEKDHSQLQLPQPDRPLYAAASWGSWVGVEAIVKLGADPNLPRKIDDPDWTPLTAACSDGHVKTVGVLLQHGADPNTAGPSEFDTSLWFAAIWGESVECVRLLLKHQADPNHALLQPPLLKEIISRGQMPESVKIAILDLLIENDPPVLLEKAAENGETPLMTAAENRDLASLRWLLKHGAQINAMDLSGRHALFHAVENNHTTVIHELLNHTEQPLLDVTNQWTEKTLLEAAMVQDISLVEILLEHGANPNFESPRKMTLLNVAVQDEAIDVVKLLVQPQRNADIHHRDEADWSPIMDATGFRPNVEIAKVLMEAGAHLSDATSSGSTPLHLAAQECEPDILRVLLDFHEPNDIQRRDHNGETPLLRITCFQCQPSLECIRLLVRAGLDVNARDSGGRSILHKSASAGPDANASHDFLLSVPGIDVNARSKRHETALHVACGRGNVALVRKLLQHNIDVNAAARVFGSTALSAACLPSFNPRAQEDIDSFLETSEQIVRELAFSGADVNTMAGISLFNALSAASLSGNTATINFLLNKSASVHNPDPLGRLPIHFAAANGVRNFETLALVHGKNIMVQDTFKKNALHWAAQFGHVETVRSILSKLSPRDRKTVINLGDVDGWTPLAWASRPSPESAHRYWVKSEPQDYAATIQCLVENGADEDVRFHIGRDEGTEALTPFQMAKRCAVEEDVLRLLTPARRTEDQRQERQYVYWSGSMCDMCLSVSGVSF